MQPTLTTKRLILRPFNLRDAKRVQQLAGDPIIAQKTAYIPHPYPYGVAEAWIEKHAIWFQDKTGVSFAIEIAESNILIGTVSLTRIADGSGNLGYWIGVPYWGQGYCSEATEALIRFGFEEMDLSLVYGRHLIQNSASGRVMEKCGLHYVKDIEVEGYALKYYERRR